MTNVALRFDGGTLEVRGLAQDAVTPSGVVWDVRAAAHRAAAASYADVVRWLTRGEGCVFDDAAHARTRRIARRRACTREARPFQREALDARVRARGRGVVVLPTGAGKTHVAVMAMGRQAPEHKLVVSADARPRPAVVRPLRRDVRRGRGGRRWRRLRRSRPLTVTTYDSAHLHMERFGAKFGLVVFDECHHLPSEAYALAARACLAPYRLGLTATPERTDGRDAILAELVGPIVYRRDIVELAGTWLADYDTERVEVDLSPSEREEYERERAAYLDFVRRHGIRMSDPRGWGESLVMHASRSADGRKAMASYRRQRELAFTAPAKLAFLEHLLAVHARDRAIVFSQDNATAYEVSRRFLLPCITHQTKVKERSAILRGLMGGTFGAVVTSRVLNEGVGTCRTPTSRSCCPAAGRCAESTSSGSGACCCKREGKRAIPLRARHQGHRRNTHEQPPPRAQRLPRVTRARGVRAGPARVRPRPAR